MSEIERGAGHLDVLVNNVGLTMSRSIEDTTIDEWRLLMRVNLEGPFIGTQAALPLMKKSALRTPYGGSIVNVSSITGIVGTAHAEAHGNAVHLDFTLDAVPGNPLAHLRMSQWLYLQDDGASLVNHDTLSKAGVILREITEYFHKDR